MTQVYKFKKKKVKIVLMRGFLSHIEFTYYLTVGYNKLGPEIPKD